MNGLIPVFFILVTANLASANAFNANQKFNDISNLHHEDQSEYMDTYDSGALLDKQEIQRTPASLAGETLTDGNSSAASIFQRKEIPLNESLIDRTTSKEATSKNELHEVRRDYSDELRQEFEIYERRRKNIQNFLGTVNDLYSRVPRMFQYHLSNVITYKAQSVFQAPVLFQEDLSNAHRQAEITKLNGSSTENLIVVQIYKVKPNQSYFKNLQTSLDNELINSRSSINNREDDEVVAEGSAEIADFVQESIDGRSNPTLSLSANPSRNRLAKNEGLNEVLRRKKQEMKILSKLRNRGLRIRSR